MAVADTIDWMAALRTYLLSNSYVTDQVGAAGVYIGRLPKGATKPGKVIVLITDYGFSDEYLPLVTPTIQARCYGEDSIEAFQVYRGLRSALHNAKRQKIEPGVGVGSGNNWLVVAKEEGTGRQENEPVTGWHFIFAQFNCIFVTFPVTG